MRIMSVSMGSDPLSGLLGCDMTAPPFVRGAAGRGAAGRGAAGRGAAGGGAAACPFVPPLIGP